MADDKTVMDLLLEMRREAKENHESLKTEIRDNRGVFDEWKPQMEKKVDQLQEAVRELQVHLQVTPIGMMPTPAASRAAPSTKHDSPKGDLSSEARRLYDLLVGDSATATSTVPRCAQSSAAPIGGIPEPAAATATLERDLRSVTPSTCSTVCVDVDTSATSTLSSPVASSAPTTASRTTVSAALVSPAVGVLLESGDHITSTKPGDHITSAKPSIGLILRPCAVIDTVVSEAYSFSLVLAPGASALPAAFLVDNVDTGEHTENGLQPWPPPWTQLKLWAAKKSWAPPSPTRSICIQNIPELACQVMLFLPWATSFYMHAESVEHIRNRIGRSGDWYFLRTMEIEGVGTCTLISFALKVQYVQLQPPMFKWSDLSCLGPYYLIASTNVDMMLDLYLERQADCTPWTWCYIDNLQWSPGSTSLAIPRWKMLMTVNCDFARVHFHWVIKVQQSTSSVLFLASLDGRAEVYHHLQGNYHCPELTHWSFSQSLVQPENLCYTPGYILVCCCALVQWKISWIIFLVSLRSWFQCYRAQSESLCSWEHFQWTIAWSPSYHLCLSIPWLFNCLLLVKVVELKPWPSWGLFLCISVVNKNLDISREPLHSSGNFQWTISCCSFSVLVGGSAVPLFVWLELKIKSSQDSHVKFNSSNRNGKLHDFVEMDITKEALDQWWDSDADKEFQEAFPLSAQPPYKALQLPWDPGVCSTYALHQGNSGSVDAGSSFLGMDTSQLPWDLGGSTRVWLVGKPKIKGGGLSTTSLHELANGPSPWALACLGGTFGGHNKPYIPTERPRRNSAGNRTERRLRPRPG